MTLNEVCSIQRKKLEVFLGYSGILRNFLLSFNIHLGIFLTHNSDVFTHGFGTFIAVKCLDRNSILLVFKNHSFHIHTYDISCYFEEVSTHRHLMC